MQDGIIGASFNSNNIPDIQYKCCINNGDIYGMKSTNIAICNANYTASRNTSWTSPRTTYDIEITL